METWKSSHCGPGRLVPRGQLYFLKKCRLQMGGLKGSVNFKKSVDGAAGISKCVRWVASPFFTTSPPWTQCCAATAPVNLLGTGGDCEFMGCIFTDPEAGDSELGPLGAGPAAGALARFRWG